MLLKIGADTLLSAAGADVNEPGQIEASGAQQLLAGRMWSGRAASKATWWLSRS